MRTAADPYPLFVLKMSRSLPLERKAFVAITLLVFSTLSLFILSHRAFLSQDHTSKKPQFHEKNAVLRHVLQGHLVQLIEAQVHKNTAGEVVRNITPPPVQVIEAVSQHRDKNSSLLSKQKSVRHLKNTSHRHSGNISLLRRQSVPNSPLRQDGWVFAAERLSKSSPNRKGTVKCLFGPKSCLQENDLGMAEAERLTNCISEAVSYMKVRGAHSGNITECSCHLRAKKLSNRRMALVSLPGSGNTWVRGLLERVTNICTGAMWCDPNLRATHFCGEGSHSSRTLVVKNHDPTIRWRGEVLPKGMGLSENNKPEFDGAIFVHRDPFDAIVAEHNRGVGYALLERAIKENSTSNYSTGHHVQSFGVEYFRDNIEWDHRVKALINIWETMIDHLMIKNRNTDRVLVVNYEDLVKNTESEVLRMLRFLGLYISPERLKEQLKTEFSTFKRNHTSNVFEHFTTTQKQLINTAINTVSSRLNSQVLQLKGYVRN